MSAVTSFDQEKAKVFLDAIKELNNSLYPSSKTAGDWSSVLAQWKILQGEWKVSAQ
jgi:hypothetical protein